MRFDAFWRILTHFDAFWHVSMHFDKFGSELILHFWAILEHFGRVQTISEGSDDFPWCVMTFNNLSFGAFLKNN